MYIYFAMLFVYDRILIYRYRAYECEGIWRALMPGDGGVGEI